MADKKNTESAVIPSEVRDLIQESQKIHGWVARLAEHSGEARQEVFDKVREDYENRLQAVNGQLSQHRVQLTDSLATRRSEVAALRDDRDTHQAELEEAKLRHAVGEYGDAQWKKHQAKITDSLDTLDELLTAEEATVKELDDIIGSIGSAGPRLVVDEPGAEEPVGETVAESVPEEASAEPQPEGVAAEEQPEPEAVATETPEAKSEADDADDADGGEYLDELEFLESLSLGDSDRFDPVSAMLEDEEGGRGAD